MLKKEQRDKLFKGSKGIQIETSKMRQDQRGNKGL